MYDIIIVNISSNFKEQSIIIENVYKFLKPGGILIIENISKEYSEISYINRLRPVLKSFQNFYFIELNHINSHSIDSNNKLFVLIKGGGVNPIFKNENKLTIITPSYRVQNLLELKKSIDFDYVDEWIIVYDGSKISHNPNLFKHNSKIKEYVYNGEGISGNPQRNYALSKITNPNTILYYLDDDNILHPKIYNLLDIMDNTKIYTFNQENRTKGSRIKGNKIEIGYIDTAMVIVPFNLCNDKTWIIDIYQADGYYIKECYEKNKDNHIFVDNNLCYYNRMTVTKK